MYTSRQINDAFRDFLRARALDYDDSAGTRVIENAIAGGQVEVCGIAEDGSFMFSLVEAQEDRAPD